MADSTSNIGKGSRIGPYEILGVLGRGGMATVYKAYQASLDRNVAIKVIAERYATDPTFAERFRREARSIARLHHPNILTVHDAGEDNGLLYIVMELVEGDTLRDEMNRHPLSLERSAKVLGQVGAALNYANKQGIIHRDIKPSNVLFDSHNDRAVLSDFGIAKMLDNTASNLTGTNEGLGTPDYMSPEQANGTQLDGRSDEYSLAAMAFELVTRQTPFHADTPIAIVMGHLSKPVPSTRQINHDVPPALDAVITKALSKDPKDRFASVGDFTEAFQKAVDNPQMATFESAPTKMLSNNGNQTGATYAQGQPASNPGFGPPAQPSWVNQSGPQPVSYQPHPPTPAPQQYSHPPTPAPQQYAPSTGPNYNQGFNSYQNTYSPPKKSNIGLLLGGIAAIAIVTIIILVAILALGGSKNNVTPTSAISQVTATSTTGNSVIPTATQGNSVLPTATAKPSETTAAPTPTKQPPATTAPVSGGEDVTPGGFPIESSLVKITADPDAQKTLEEPYEKLGADIHVSLFTSSKSIDDLKSYYKGGEPGGWAFLNESTQSNFVYEYFIKDGKGALFGAAPITKVFINAADTPASLRSQLKEGDTFVFLVDNLDYAKAAATPTASASLPNSTAAQVKSSFQMFGAVKSEAALTGVYRREL